MFPRLLLGFTNTYSYLYAKHVLPKDIYTLFI